MQWLNQFQFAGYYIAKEKGFYDEAGLNVEILEMKDGFDVVKEVTSGNATYGTGRSSLIIDRFKGEKISILAAIFQDAPSVLITTNTDLKSPKDLKNQNIMVTHDELNSTSYLSMFASQGLSLNDIKIQPHSFDLQDLVSGKTDAMACYISNEPYTLSQQNIAFNIINPKTYGYDFYGDLLFTSQDEIQNNPQRVIDFTKASLKGWEYAFDNIEETAKLIFDKYNTQSKSLEHLIYEGNSLKKLAYSGVDKIGILDNSKIEQIAKIYAITGLMDFDYDFRDFVDPLKINTQTIKIGILSTLGKAHLELVYGPLIDYLTQNIAGYAFELEPLSFDEIGKHLKDDKIDFLITSPSSFTMYEVEYGLVKIATKQQTYDNQKFNNFGSVIFSKKGSGTTNLSDLESKKIVSVNKHSCGGFLIPRYEVLKKYNIDMLKSENLDFVTSHHKVVEEVLSKKYDIGIVRTGILEQLINEGLVKLDDIQVLEEKHYKNFPHMISTDLYPEWSFVQTNKIPEILSKKVLLNLLTFDKNYISWITPLDDSQIHKMHKELGIKPYDINEFSIGYLLQEYKYYLIIVIVSLIFILALLIKLIVVNKKLYIQNEEIENFNYQLEDKIKKRTQELHQANTRLQEMVSKDFLTGVSSRLYFYEEASSSFDFAKRNKMDLSILLFDIDKFKSINDTYGHDAGDEVLKKFTLKIKDNLRQSDTFGRLGGEEFCICTKNIDLKGAVTLANKLRIVVERNECEVNTRVIHITTSIGVAQMKDEDANIDDVIKRADIALYQAKNRGRNQVVVAT